MLERQLDRKTGRFNRILGIGMGVSLVGALLWSVAGAFLPDDVRRRYAPALAAFDKAMAGFPSAAPDLIVEAVMWALTAARPKLRVAVGKGLAPMLIAAALPIGARDAMLTSSLGATKIGA